ncbi:MAG: hypothetical protein AAFO69_07185, partial [Bacteroidota bacterium]
MSILQPKKNHPTLKPLFYVLLFCFQLSLAQSFAQTLNMEELNKWGNTRNELLRARQYKESIPYTAKIYQTLVDAGKYRAALDQLAIGAEAYIERGMFAETDSIMAFIKKEAVTHLEDPTVIYTTLYANIAASWQFRNENDSAIWYFKQAVQYFNYPDDRWENIRAYLVSSIGACYANLGELDSAVQ